MSCLALCGQEIGFQVERFAGRDRARHGGFDDDAGVQRIMLDGGPERGRRARRKAVDRVGLVGPDEHLVGEVQSPGSDIGHALGLGEQPVGSIEPFQRCLIFHREPGCADRGGARIDQRLGDAGECAQRALFGRSEVARLGAEHAECADRQALRAARMLGADRHAGIETDVGPAGDERIGGEAIVARGIGDQEDVVLRNGMGAEGIFARRLRGIDSVARLEPLAMIVDQRDQRRLGPQKLAGERDDLVKLAVGRRVENLEAGERRQALELYAVNHALR
jgi:hypothetical protein